MKHIPFYLLSVSLLTLAGCSDNDSTPIAPIKEKTYSGVSELEVFYNDKPMMGKTAVFAQEDNKALVKVFSEFDLSQLSEFGLSGKLPAPGIIPGSPHFNINTDVKNNGSSWEFSGSSENDFCTYKYTGYATPDNFKLYISDAALKNGGMSPAIWKPAPIKKGDDGSISSTPFYIDWEYRPIKEIDINLSPIIEALTVIPVIPVYDNTAYMSVSQAIFEIVKGVAFLSDGNILISYISSVGGAAHLDQTAPNGFQYVMPTSNMLKFYVNPLSFFSFILENTSGSTPESEIDLNATGLWPAKDSQTKPDANSPTMENIKKFLASPTVQKILKSIMPQLLPMVAEGIPMAYNLSDNSLKIFIDTEMAVGIMTPIVKTLIEDNTTIELIKKYIASDPRLAALLPDVEKAIALLPKAIEQTTTFNIGFNLIPYE